MSIGPNVLIAAKVLQGECANNSLSCVGCQLEKICRGRNPEEWSIPDPPPEPTEHPRIEWARMLPDKELIIAMSDTGCSKCDDEDDPNCYQECAEGVLPWWHKVVTIEQFRRDVGLE